MNVSVYKYVLLVLLVVTKNVGAATPSEEFPAVAVEVNQQHYTVEYAYSDQQRALGLMHRLHLCNDCGMLFNFQRTKQAQMWMKNTLIPLDVAFIRKDGSISEITQMQANDDKLTKSRFQVMYAWEMNQGWFAKNAIQVGDKVVIKPVE
ncbi:DUF192 domain-containing protein [Agarivorans sp. B2Z047]|uniref:DUF192 domain-containing protein n=1 Tax=Agarivorans sp. B2Z047 TaxID=2652721 RepID=UPI001D1542F0|nr:DUF192 domain-containing protein [Agarivorans sp. B2Z047]UQN43488.1 DUF192 domain-containing protein [Agarivorans sp. B2Z047]